MKKRVLIIWILVLTFSFLLLTFKCSAQWFELNTGVDVPLTSIFFTDANTGYAVGYCGTIIKTTDSGITWLNKSLADSCAWDDLFSVYFTTSNIGYAVSDRGNIFKTIDAGNSWDKTYLDFPYILTSVAFTDLDNGFIVGCRPETTYIFNTTDAGNNWKIQDSLPGVGYFDDIYFTDTSIGYAVGGACWYTSDSCMGVIYKTSNAKSWVKQYSAVETPGGLFGVHFINSNTGYAVGEEMYKTTNGGATWILQSTKINETLTNVYFTDNNTGYTVGQHGGIYNTTNGGISWYKQDSLPPVQYYGIFFTDKNTGYVCGFYGTIMKTTNGGNWIYDVQNPMFNIKCFPNPFNHFTYINYQLTEKSNVSLEVYDVLGREIEVLQNKIQEKGIYKINFDAEKLSDGIYFIKFKCNNVQSVLKLLKE